MFCRLRQNRGRKRFVGARVGKYARAETGKHPVGIGADFDGNHEVVALDREGDALASVINHSSWPSGRQRDQRKVRLYVQIFLTAERAAHRRMVYPDTVLRKCEDGRELAPIGKWILSAADDGNPPLLINEGNTGFWLQIGMFLPPGSIGNASDMSRT